MLYVEIRTQKQAIGKMEILNLQTMSGGRTRYSVRYILPNGIVIDREVMHRRSEGALRLVQTACRAIRHEMEKFFSYPEEKVIQGALKSEDIPKRYAKQLGKFLGVHTGIVIDGKCATFVSDIEGFLNSMKYGFVPEWD